MNKKNRTELYTRYFIKALETHQLQDGEIIRQCTDSSLGKKYYNPKWAVSNLGIVYSIRTDGLKPLKPWACGVLMCELQLLNTFHEKHQRVYLSRLVAVYFCDRSLMAADKDHPITPDTPPEQAEDIFARHWQVHHIQPRDMRKPLETNDRADNLQILSKAQHAELTKIQRCTGSLFHPTKAPQLKSANIEVDTHNANIIIQEIVGLPADVSPEHAEKIMYAAIAQDMNPLEVLRKLFGKQVSIQCEYYRLQDCPQFMEQISQFISAIASQNPRHYRK